MIRTHKPRGYAWTCASLFQQTPDFRNISYESCVVEDEGDDFAPAERCAKRQRVEKLANDFLNGHALHIRAARLPPQGLQHAVARAFPRPRDARRTMEGRDSDVIMPAEAVWEDVQDQWEVLQGYNAVDGDEVPAMPADASDHENNEVVVEVRARASCTSVRRRAIAELAVGPSDEALRQAAALRDRKLPRRRGRLSVELPSVQEARDDPSHSSLQATLSDSGPAPTAAWTSSRWLQSGRLELRHKAVDEECSKDELGLSSLPSPSQKAAARPAVSLRRGRGALSQRTTGVASSISRLTGDAVSSGEGGEHITERTNEISEPPGATTCVLIPPPDSREQENSSVPGEESQGGSQAQLLRRQGIRAAPGKSQASFGAISESSASLNVPSAVAPTERPAVSPAIQASVWESAKANAKKLAKGKRATKSTGAAPAIRARNSTRRKSAPTESQAAAESVADLPIDQQREMNAFRAGENAYLSVPGKDSSPFMFRKRVSKFNNSKTPDIDTIAMERKQQQVRTKTPKRVQFPSDSFRVPQTKTPQPGAADPLTPLMNEYLNRLLPNRESGSSSASLRKSLRDEMRLAGAEFSRLEGEAPSSQPGPGSPGEQTDHGSTINANEATPELPRPQLWPGTQVLLAEAHKDLFNSPNKENATSYPGDKITPYSTRDIPRRQPLQPLSQEPLPMPSTQALLDDWQGWSSIKKPRGASGKQCSTLPSPTSHRGSNLIASELVTSYTFDEARLRKSSLRYSMSYNDSPDQGTESLPVAAFFPARQSAPDQSTSGASSKTSNTSAHFPAKASNQIQDHRPRRPSGGVASSAAFTTQGQVVSTTEPNTVSSLSLHAGLSSHNQQATGLQSQEDSSMSFSPIARPEPQTTDQFKPSPKPTTTIFLLNEQDSWSFSPLAQSTTHIKDIPTDLGTPTATMSTFQQAQIVGGDDASGRILSQVDMDPQDIDATLTELMGDVLGSAGRAMPRGTSLYSQ